MDTLNDMTLAKALSKCRDNNEYHVGIVITNFKRLEEFAKAMESAVFNNTFGEDVRMSYSQIDFETKIIFKNGSTITTSLSTENEYNLILLDTLVTNNEPIPHGVREVLYSEEFEDDSPYIDNFLDEFKICDNQE